MRIKTLQLLFAAGIVATWFGTAASAEPVPPPIQAHYSEMVKRFEQGNLKAFGAFYSADYVSVDPSGKSSSRSQYLSGIGGLLKGAKKTVAKIVCKSATRQGGIVNVSFDATGRMTGSNGVTTFHEVGVDSWKKIGKTWLQIKTVDTKFDVVSPKPKTE